MYDALETPMIFLLHRTSNPVVFQPPMSFVLGSGLGRIPISLAAEALGTLYDRICSDMARSTVPPAKQAHSSTRAAVAAGATLDELLPCAAAGTYKSQLRSSHAMSMKLYDVDHGCPGLMGRSTDDVMEVFSWLISEQAVQQGLSVSMSFHNVALTAGCVALTCNLVRTEPGLVLRSTMGFRRAWERMPVRAGVWLSDTATQFGDETGCRGNLP
eukprot:366039-Chlamydomonas_euryale.AAC.22